MKPSERVLIGAAFAACVFMSLIAGTLARELANRRAADSFVTSSAPTEVLTPTASAPDPSSTAIPGQEDDADAPSVPQRRIDLTNFTGDLYLAELMGGTIVFIPGGIPGSEHNQGVFAGDSLFEAFDGLETTVAKASVKRVGDELTPTGGPPALVIGGTFSGDQLTLQLIPRWLKMPLGIPDRVELRRATPAEYEAALQRAASATTLRLLDFPVRHVRPGPAVSGPLPRIGPVAVRVNRDPLTVEFQSLGGFRIYRPARGVDGVWVIDRVGATLRTFDGRTAGGLPGPISYMNPVGPGNRYLELQESGDGRTRLLVNWREGAQVFREGEPPLSLPPGTYRLSPDGSMVASYPAIDLTVVKEEQTNQGREVVRYAPTRLLILNLVTGRTDEVATDLQYVRYYISDAEDWGYRPPSPQWSASGRYLIYRDWARERNFIFDVTTRVRQEVGPGIPQWSAVPDVAVVSDNSSARIVDATSGTTNTLPIPQDGRRYEHYFDATGTLLVRSRSGNKRGDAGELVIFTMSGQEVARWEGTASPTNPEWQPSDGPLPVSSVSAYRGTPIFSSSGTNGCAFGSVIHPLLATGRVCLERGTSGDWSPGGALLALHLRGMGASLPVAIFNPATRETVMFDDAYRIVWSPDGSMLVALQAYGRSIVYIPSTGEALRFYHGSFSFKGWVGETMVFDPS